jgi:hypothetical protein
MHSADARGKVLADLGRKAFDDIRPSIDRALDLANMVYPTGAQTVLMLVSQQLSALVALSIVAQDIGGEGREEVLRRACHPDSLLFAALLVCYQPSIHGDDPIAWVHAAFERVSGKPFEYASGPYALGSGIEVNVMAAG